MTKVIGTARKYLWRGLDLVNFEVIEILPQTADYAVIIMLDKRENAVKPWCTEFRGSGRYFGTQTKLEAHVAERKWRKRKNERGGEPI